jgi:hypothetical protein
VRLLPSWSRSIRPYFYDVPFVNPRSSIYVWITLQVKEGDIVTMCSATFGDEMWSTRGVGLTRVLAAIRVRSGATVKLVFESPNDFQKKKQVTESQIKAREEAQRTAQAKKDLLLAELEQDEERLNPKKFFGLF